MCPFALGFDASYKRMLRHVCMPETLAALRIGSAWPDPTDSTLPTRCYSADESEQLLGQP
ncbi:MAG: hypothetical protein KDN22_30110 [Verrucomicrobiae bacterium]|nr:hypothetical protein [Verrucomicrobiae bacterium]